MTTKTLTIGELNCDFDNLMFPFGSFNTLRADGFTIRGGKILFWYVVPKNNAFDCYPLEINNHYKRRINPTTQITIHYNF